VDLIRRIAIQGDGVAARCCAHLLSRAGFDVRLEAVDRPRIPAIMIGDAAVALIRDVFELPHAFAGERRVRARVVRWGEGGEANRLEHSAAVVSEERLLEILGRPAQADFAEPDFTIFAAGGMPSEVTRHAFGSRYACAARVELNRAEPEASYIESVDDGWLFLVPDEMHSGWLLAIGASLESQLARSRTIAIVVGGAWPVGGQFPACPRVTTPLAGPGWLACGSAALAFDPICGDGTAQAVREAILASAVVRALADGADAAALRVHYENRLLAGMQRHIALCAEFYRSGGRGPWWATETELLAGGFRWCAGRLAQAPPPRYRLRDYRLESVL
jgi:hypothetical protein